MPAAASSGSVSSKIRPLESARVITLNRPEKDFTAKNAKAAEETLTFHDVPKDPGAVSASFGALRGSMNALDARAQLRELLLDAFVTAIEVVDAIDAGLTLCDETCDDEARRGTQVGRHDGRALQLRNAAHDSRVSRDLDVGAETLHFQGMHETVLENGFGDRGSTLGDCVEHHQLCLHVGRKSRIRSGPDVDRLGPPRHGEGNRFAPGLQLSARLSKFFEYRLEGSGIRAAQGDAPSRRRGCGKEGSGLDAIGHDAVRRPVQPFYSLERNRVGACAGYPPSNPATVARCVHHFGLAPA